MNEHLNIETIDLYILNQNLLGEKLDVVKSHLESCELCSNKFQEMNQIYSLAEGTSNVYKIREKIIFTLEKNSIPDIKGFNEIFRTKPKSKFAFTNESFISLLRKFDSMLDSVFSLVNISSPIARWSIAGAIPILILFSIFIPMQFKKAELTTKNQILTFDSVKKDVMTSNIDTSINIPKKTISENKKTHGKEKQIDRKYSFAVLSDVTIDMNGEYNDYSNCDIYPVYNKYYNSVGLVVFDKGVIDENNIIVDLNRNIKDKNYQKYIIFPKTILNNDPKNKNYLEESIRIDESGLEVRVYEDQNTNPDNGFIKYKFDKDFNIRNVETNTNFKDNYNKFLIKNKNDSTTYIQYLDTLLNSVKNLK